MVDVQIKLIDYLDGDSALGLTKGQNLFAGPDLAPSQYVPVNAIFCTTVGSTEPVRAMGFDEVREVLVSFNVRWSSYKDGVTKAREILNALLGPRISDLTFVAPTSGEPDYLARSEEGNHRWNFRVRVHYNHGA